MTGDERKPVYVLDLSVLSGTAGRWSGHVRLLNHLVQEIAKGNQIIDSKYNTGSHHGIWTNSAISKQSSWFRAHVRKRQRRKTSGDTDVEHPIADDFWNA